MSVAGRAGKLLQSLARALDPSVRRRRRRLKWYIEFVIRDGNIVEFSYDDAHQSRQEATIHLLLDALKTIKYELPRNRKVLFHTTDRPPATAKEPEFAYSRMPGSKNVIAVPDFSFWNWPDVGIPDYTQMTQEMVEAGAKPPRDDRLFWIGNVQTSPVRARLMDLAANDPRINAIDITWVKEGKPECWASDDKMETQGGNYVSLPDHCRYRYLIDIEGIGFSARLKFFFFSGRPVFVQERPWREFYFDRIEPFVHFIPVAPDLSDLTDRLDWAQAHPDECERIAANALAFARENLTRGAAIRELRRAIAEVMA